MKLFGYILGMGLILLPHSTTESAVYTKKVHSLNIWKCFVFPPGPSGPCLTCLRISLYFDGIYIHFHL